MKKMLAALAASMMMCSSFAVAEQTAAQTVCDWSNLNEDTAIIYSDIVSEYCDALQDLDSTALTDEQREELLGEYTLAKDCGGFGYNLVDVDRNGTTELIIGVTPTDDTYFGKMILEMDTVDENGKFTQVLKSGERSRYYYAGGNTFAYVGSNSANDSIDTTMVYENGQLTDTGSATAEADYVQIELEPVEVNPQ